LGSWQKKYGKDLVVIGVTDETPAKVQKFMHGTAMNYVVATDPSHKMYKQIGIQSIPHALVITPDGIVRWQGFPDQQGDILTEDVLAQIINTSKRQTVAMK
jgi:peroxiredoxin